MPSLKKSSGVQHPHYRPDIDGLMAVAVLSVLVFHAFPEYLPGGFIGVDIFFVISGYLICTILFQNLAQDSFSFLDFYSRRIRRIFPALITVLLSSWVIAWLALLPEEFKSLGKHILGGAGFVSNLVLWGESGYFDVASNTKPLLHLWSLGIEEQFYLFWPLLIWLAYRMRLSMIYFTLGFLAVSFVLNIALINAAPVTTFYSPFTRIWELLIGAVLSWALLPNPQNTPDGLQVIARSLGETQKNISAVVGGLLIILALIFISEASSFPGWWALLPVLGGILLLLAGSGAWINRKILSSKAMVWFGLISFPLYLWHWPLLSFAHIIDGKSSATLRLLLALTSIFLAWLTYRFIEKPLRFGVGVRSNALQTRSIWALIFLMGVMSYIGYAAYIRDGIPVQRMLFRSSNPMLNEVMTYKFQTGPAWEMGSCYLTEQQQASEFKACGANNLDPHKPTMVLWGDSHAAHLYPGLKESYAEQYNLVFRSASACPPILQYDKAIRPYCKAINDSTLELIKKIHPDVVILAGNWRDNPWPDLSKTIQSLKALGIASINLVGPVPVWENNLPKQIFLYCKQNTPCEIPRYMQAGLVTQVFKLDAAMSQFSQKEKIHYLSPIQILCKEEGCLIRTGESGNTITAWDSEHFTDWGSRYLVAQFGNIR